jgi:uncharacterized protein
MYDSDAKGISYSGGFFLLIGFALVAIFIASLVSIPVFTQMTGISASKMNDAMSNPAYADTFRVIQVITAVIGFFLPAVLTAALMNRRPFKLLGFTGRITFTQIAIVTGLMIASLYFSTFLSYVNENLPISHAMKLKFDTMENSYDSSVETIISLNNFGEYLIAIFILAILPAVCEETLFRGGLQNFLTRWTNKPWFSIIITSIIFSAAHLSFYGFLSRFFLGIVLGLIYEYSGKIWLNMLAHFLNNAVAITAIYILHMNGQSIKDAIGNNQSSWTGVVVLPLVVGLLILFKKNSPRPPENSEGKNEALRGTPFY